MTKFLKMVESFYSFITVWLTDYSSFEKCEKHFDFCNVFSTHDCVLKNALTALRPALKVDYGAWSIKK